MCLLSMFRQSQINHTSFEALKAALPVKVNPGQRIVLCRSHYHKLYRQFKAPPCARCGATPKRGTCFNRQSPDPITISQVLSDNAGFNDVNLSESDYICFSCYKSHLVIIKSLVQALKGNPDLASLPSDLVAPTVQMLFVCSGCDYISYFSGFGKAAFLNTFFQHASFITGEVSQGRLSYCSNLDLKQGYLAFLTLIGTLYFKKHYSAFVSLREYTTTSTPFYTLKFSVRSAHNMVQ